ncbi:MAG: pilus assembly protein [Selenomonadaceae bacterium]|nr:pilus assembly protein [Selenomonadaceae bacterium]
MRFDKIIPSRINFRQHGQVMALFALLVPVLFIFAGVGMDLGWYYLNVSRLQNAADAAALAGARALIETNDTLSEYKGVQLIDKFYAEDDTGMGSDDEGNIDTVSGDEAAAAYVLRNLSSDENWTGGTGNYTMNSNWGVGNSKIIMAPSLYKYGGNFYYVVNIKESVQHFFMPGLDWLDSMNAPVIAVAMLTKNSGGTSTDTVAETYTPVEIVFDANGGVFSDGTTASTKSIKNPDSMEDDEVSESLTPDTGTPTYESNTKSSVKEFKGVWSTNPNPTEGQIIDIYQDGAQLTKTELAKLFGDNETVTLYAVWEEVLPHNNRTLWEQMHYLIAKYVYDPDWNVSVNKYGGKLHDLNFIPTGNAAVLKNNKVVYINMAANTKANNSGEYIKDVDRLFLDFRPDGFIIRVHALINVNAAYDVRSDRADDPLYIRIEAEPKIGNTGNEPQQIIININADNTADSKRPLFFYYDGPLTYNGTYPDRVTQPVILNMTTDFKGVLFMPEVPVVIHGNGHKFEGFIVASEFRYAATSGKKTAKYTQNGLAAYYYIDDSNNIQTVLADGNNALELYNYNAENSNRFNLGKESKFRNFTAEVNVNFMYVYYDYNYVMDSSPFYLNTGDLIPLYKLVNGKQVRVTKWDDVNLYDNPANVSSRQLIPKIVTDTTKKGTVRLTNGSPSPLYDEAGNPVYFCDDYVNLTGTYTVFTLDRVADGTRDEKEFLLTKTDELNVSNTDDWK